MENKKMYLYIIGALGALVVVMLFWKVFAVQGVEKKMRAQQADVVEKSQKIISEQTSHFLRMTTVPLVWAVRKEMLQDNYGQINEYATSFVRERNIQQILLVKADGVIAVATDKKVEGSPASSLYPAQTFEKNDIDIVEDKDGNLQVAAPVMGLNARIGTLVLIYKPEKVGFDLKP
jgi:hypothetical protein